MKKLISMAAAFAMFSALGLFASVHAAEDDIPTIKAIMKINAGPKSALSKLKAQVKGDSPDWASVKKLTAEFDKMGSSLPKNKAPKGDQSAYETLATAFATAAHDLHAAAEKEDLDAVKTALGKISNSCMTCHKAHKGK